MKIETIDFGNDREIYIIDGAVDIGSRFELYHMCCQLPYRINNSSRQEIQGIADKRLKCDLELDNPLIKRFLEDNKETSGVINKYVPKEKYLYVRSYVNLGTHSDICNIHIDKNDDSRTILYYANHDWSCNMGGHTMFFDDDGNTKYIVEIKPGRLCIFDGRIPHTVMPMNIRISPSFRFTVAFKFESISSHYDNTQKFFGDNIESKKNG